MEEKNEQKEGDYIYIKPQDEQAHHKEEKAAHPADAPKEEQQTESQPAHQTTYTHQAHQPPLHHVEPAAGNSSGILRCVQSSMKWAPFSADSEKRMPLFATMPTG